MQFWLKLRAKKLVKCEKFVCNNPNLDLIHMDPYIYNLVNICQLVLKISSGNKVFCVNQEP